VLSHSGSELIIEALAENSRDIGPKTSALGGVWPCLSEKRNTARPQAGTFHGTFHVYTFYPPLMVHQAFPQVNS